MNNLKKKIDGLSLPLFIIILIIGFEVFPPLGIFLLLTRLGVFGNGTSEKNISADSQRNIRMSKYKIMAEGQKAVSIEYLASAVGISYESALRDIQQMIAAGQFGPDAYINYVDKRLVLSSEKGKTSSAKTGTSSAKAEKASGSSKKKKNKGTYGSIPAWLLVAGIIASGIGLLYLGDVLDALSWWGFEAKEFLLATFWLASGAAAFFGRHTLKSRESRFKIYQAAVKGRDFITLNDLESRTGFKSRTVNRDLEIMIDKGLLGESAYIDHGNNTLILTAGATVEPAKPVAAEPPKDDENRYRAILREIRELNDAIPDETLTKQIDEMENLTAKIFRAVSDNPEKLPQIKSFMSYYLPTTLKLLHSYADFDQVGADGNYVKSAKADIERILNTLVDGFKKQLDKLYESEAMDISSDINVLENMLRRDGLSGDGSGFGGTVAGGSGK